MTLEVRPHKPKSDRHRIADHIAEKLRKNNLCTPYGGDVSLSNDRKYYVTLFSLPANLDGEIRVYSPGFIRVSYTTRFQNLPPTDQRVFTGYPDVLRFIRLSFIEFDGAAALKIPVKPPKETSHADA